MQTAVKPRLSLLRIIEMNIGFFGLQFSFGLQQANMGPIYGFLGADEATMPLLWLAGPMTGLIIQPIVGAMSDRTNSRFGRRTPYFLIGAIICTISLFLMPYSSALWIAASLLWILDAGNNITMEPYRAYVADRLVPDQRSIGFLTQSAFTGLAQTLSYLAPTLLTAFVAQDVLDDNGIPVIVRIAFIIGAILSISTIVWSVWRVPELPMTEDEKAVLEKKPLTVKDTFAEIVDAIRDMPKPMRQLALASARRPHQQPGCIGLTGHQLYTLCQAVEGGIAGLNTRFQKRIIFLRNQIKALLLRASQCLYAIFGNHDIATQFFQHGFRHPLVNDIIFHQQYPAAVHTAIVKGALGTDAVGQINLQQLCQGGGKDMRA